MPRSVLSSATGPRRPIKPVLLIAGALLAVIALRYLLVPGIWLVGETPSIDRNIAAREARLQPIEGRVVDVQITEGHEQHKNSMLYVSTSVVYAATPPGASHPARTMPNVYGKYPITHRGDVPAEVPRIGNPHPLWYDPDDPTYLTFHAPGSATATVAIAAWILIALGAVLAVVAGLMIVVALRRGPVIAA